MKISDISMVFRVKEQLVRLWPHLGWVWGSPVPAPWCHPTRSRISTCADTATCAVTL